NWTQEKLKLKERKGERESLEKLGVLRLFDGNWIPIGREGKERASDFPRDYDGACLQMRLSYSPCAHLFLFLVQWTDCNLAGALGLLRILIYEAYDSGKTTMSIYERKASLREFYAIIFPSLMQLQRGITEIEDRKQREVCATKYKRQDGMDKGKLTEVEQEREEECGICMEVTTKVVLPNCSHALCIKRMRSQSCPFCRDTLKRVNSGDLWIYTHSQEITDLNSITIQNLTRLFMYVDKLPLVVPDPMFFAYDPHFSVGVVDGIGPPVNFIFEGEYESMGMVSLKSERIRRQKKNIIDNLSV
ncbi:hypothetical protein V2J09_018559, partial [Rumex salicifolius]